MPKRPPAHRTPAEGDRETLFGLRAVLAIFARRADDMLRLAYSAEVRAQTGELVKWARARGIPCDERTDVDLARIADSPMHEGLCVEVRARHWTPPAELADALMHERGIAVALDRVRNPYNVGSILRSAAFFGIDAAIVGASAPHSALAPTAVRVAEGGAEQLRLARTTDLADTLTRLRARGVRVVGGESSAPTNYAGFAFARPTVLVLGHEREGLSERVRSQCDARVAIRGRGAVESLNVSVAAAVLMAECVRAG